MSAHGTQRFSGQTAVITGAASGIGAATARRMATEGAAVVLVDVAQEAGRRTELEIRDQGGRALFVPGDVAEQGTWEELLQLAHQHFGPVDVVHSNAYVHCAGGPDRLAREDWDRVLAVNLTSLYLACRVMIADLSHRRGNVVATSSVHSLTSLPDYSAYAASKGGLNALIRQLAVQYGPEVRFNAVIPGPIDTGVWEPSAESKRDSAARATVVGRLGTPDEVAAAVCFLAGGDASFITGTILVVDGGWSVKKESG